MQPLKLIRSFALVVVYSAILLWPWPGVQEAYGRFFRELGNVSFYWFGFWPDGRVIFLDVESKTLRADVGAVLPFPLPDSYQPPPPGRDKDTLMVLRNRQVSTFTQLRTNSRIVGYWPAALLIAMTLATPLPWKRRLGALFWGLCLVHVFVVLRLGLTLAANAFFVEGKAYQLASLSPFWMNILQRCEQVAVENPTVSFVVPAMIWFLVACRRLPRLLPAPEGDSAGQTSTEQPASGSGSPTAPPRHGHAGA